MKLRLSHLFSRCEVPQSEMYKTSTWKQTLTNNQIIKAQKIFNSPISWRQINHPSQLKNEPWDLPEICIVGRSNVGKSSLINSILGQSVARVSKTPGRTQAIHFYKVGEFFHIVDMPGHGYAKISKEKRKVLQGLLGSYIQCRPDHVLKIICLLFDCRHVITEEDYDLLSALDAQSKPYMVVLTKADKISLPELDEIIKNLEKVLTKHTKCVPEVMVTSATENFGIDRLKTSQCIHIQFPFFSWKMLLMETSVPTFTFLIHC